jgi:hypothetical protein
MSCSCNTELAQKIAAALEQKKPWMLGSLAQECSVTEKEAAQALPENMCSFTSGSRFEEVWQALGSWEKATFIMQHEGHVIELKCRIPAGKSGHGYYNIMGEEALGGHIKADAITDICFLSMPFMGLESHSVQFFNAAGKVVFSIYAGRENHKIIPAVKEAFLSLKDAMKA